MRAIVLCISLLLAVCSCARRDVEEPIVVRSIASLHQITTLYHTTRLSENIRLEGRVVANDRYGEFARRLVVEDGSAGVEILCDRCDLYREYPFGSTLRIECNGLWLSNSGGRLRLGAEPSEGYPLGFIASDKVGRYIRRLSYSELPPEALEVEFREIAPLHINRYVAMRRVEIVNRLESGCFCDVDSLTGRGVTTTHTLRNSLGDTILLEIDAGVKYAKSTTPSGALDLYVVVDNFNDNYVARITNASFVKP